ncbi:hypothetical protein BHE74_00046665 [Ensete ventricosum]|nr:hypothetical protein GW17_00044948 [Ensete ventricosum]RWW47358.1 hypothetical protein BHE74_00046665 [Ensete ventricosum]
MCGHHPLPQAGTASPLPVAVAGGRGRLSACGCYRLYPQESLVHATATTIMGSRTAAFIGGPLSLVRPPSVGGCTTTAYAPLLPAHRHCSAAVLPQPTCYSRVASTTAAM